MSNIDFSGQVAVITGAGRGIGREYAKMLAARGAHVVVNDLGVGVTGNGIDSNVAAGVVAEIHASGGSALANVDDISTPEGGDAVIRSALDAYGEIHVLIHNAGSLVQGPFESLDLDAVRRLFDTHLLGAFYVGQPVWRQMLKQDYGRMLLTTSVALFGAPELTAYSAAKAGIVGLTKALSREAEAAGADIKVNAISPTAQTRSAAYSHRGNLAAAAVNAAFGNRLDPRNVAAVGVPLVSRDCPVSGECIKAGGASASRVVFAMTEGWASERVIVGPEEVSESWNQILSAEKFTYPRSSHAAREILLRRSMATRGEDDYDASPRD